MALEQVSCCGPAQRLPGTVVDLICEGGQVIGAVSTQVALLGEVVGQQPFMFSLLPRCQGLARWQK
jgi:hypothetical protein